VGALIRWRDSVALALHRSMATSVPIALLDRERQNPMGTRLDRRANSGWPRAGCIGHPALLREPKCGVQASRERRRPLTWEWPGTACPSLAQTSSPLNGILSGLSPTRWTSTSNGHSDFYQVLANRGTADSQFVRDRLRCPACRIQPDSLHFLFRIHANCPIESITVSDVLQDSGAINVEQL